MTVYCYLKHIAATATMKTTLLLSRIMLLPHHLLPANNAAITAVCLTANDVAVTLPDAATTSLLPPQRFLLPSIEDNSAAEDIAAAATVKTTLLPA